MESMLNCRLLDHFATIQDYRDPRWSQHLLIDILVIALCAVLCGADGWEEIETFGRSHLDWFQQHLELPNGIPHHDTFRRVFERIRPDQFEASFQSWVQSVVQHFKQEVVGVDGKSMRGSYTDSTDKTKGMLHIVSAWANQNNLILGQIKTHDKSNEITAIPQLLRTLVLSGCIVTIDAMGCQRAIAKEIREQGADYILTVKENQKTLHTALEKAFIHADSVKFEALVYDQHEEKDFAHGRIETRKCTVLPMMYLHEFKEKWEGLSSLVRIQSERIIKRTGEITAEISYCISSLPCDAELILSSKRQHWGVENQVHWVLDVVFKEDASRIRDRASAQNFSALRRLAINMIKRETGVKKSIRQRRMMAGWNIKYLEKVLSVN
jgi:predicted transposase YbfD/YdcC